MNIRKLMLKHTLLLLTLIGLTACDTDNVGSEEQLTFADIATTFSGDLSGSINEDDAAVSGTVSVNGPDGSVSLQAQSGAAQSFGSFSIDTAGQWTYTLDNTSADVQGLNEGASLSEEISITSATNNVDTIVITINGVNDDAVLGGVSTGSIDNNSTASVTGELSLTDADEVVDTIIAQTNVTTTYGTFSVDASGLWSYLLDVDNADVQALTGNSDPLTDVIAVSTADGIAGSVTITINGTDNTPATFGGDITGSLNSDATDPVTGTVTVSDPDMGEAAIVAQSDAAQTYGSFSIDAAGVWAYTLDTANATVLLLGEGEMLTDMVAIISADMTPATITITINGVASEIVPTFEAVLQNADMQTYPTVEMNNNDLVDAWTVDPDNTFNDMTDSLFNFWRNDALETWVSDPLNNGGTGTTDKASSSGTDAMSAGGTSNRSLKFDSSGERAYQPFEVETGVEYTISAFVKSESTPVGDVEGTFYILSGEPASDNDLSSLALVSQDVVVTGSINTWQQVSFSFTASSTFSFPQGRVDENAADILTSVDQKFVVFYFVPTNTVTGTNEVFLTDIVLGTPAFVEQPTATFAAVLQNADMQTYPTAEMNNNDLVDAWTVDPDNTFNDMTDTPFNFWRNDALEAWVSDPTNNGGTGTTDKGSSSGTDAMSAGGTSNRSLKFDSSGERAYQPFEVETGIEYSLSAFVKSESTPVGQVEGTFYVLSGEPASDNDLAALTLASEEVVVAGAINTWQQVSFSFTADATFNFAQGRVDENAADILISTDQKFVIFYFVPTNTVTGTNEVFLTDVVIGTPGF